MALSALWKETVLNVMGHSIPGKQLKALEVPVVDTTLTFVGTTFLLLNRFYDKKAPDYPGLFCI
jgi:hypothetical protein